MKKSELLLFGVLILFLLPLRAVAEDFSSIQQHFPHPFPRIKDVSQEKAMQQRADKIIKINDALIQKTIQANGGNYFHQGQSKILIFNQKIYRDFSIRVINGNRLIIDTEDGTFQMDVLDR